MASPFARKLAKIALDLHTKFHMMNEGDPPLTAQIKKFWAETGEPFPGVSTPWSAVFISSCVKQAGAADGEFRFSAQHSVFVHSAIQNEANHRGVFRGVDPFGVNTPDVGDILQNNRGGTSHDYTFAKANADYPSHSAIVVEIGQDEQGGYAMTVGGNESDSIRRTVVRLLANGRIKPKPHNNFICLIKTMK